MRPNFELLLRVLVDERRSNHAELLDPGGQRHRPATFAPVLSAVSTMLGRRLVENPVIVGLEADANLLRSLVVPSSFIVSPVTYCTTLVTTPAPTVRPPSRIAKRNPSSIATGSINSTCILMLSPGITISTPSGSLIAPVTSVVRM